MDLFLFYFFWELMLVPLYFLIAIWGHEHRIYAAIKFFLFTQGSSLLMLLAILGLYFIHGRATGVYTFNYFELLGTPLDVRTEWWLMLGFAAAFAVKLPVVPLHTWLPDAHTEAPTAGSVDLAGLVLKVGAYGFLRFVLPLFPVASQQFAPAAMALGVAGILYGALLALSQTDLKRLVAYTSISHMGFVLLGIFAWNQTALQGVIVIMLAHGLSTGALFVLVGDLQERMATRDLRRMGGLWTVVPRMGAAMMLFALASLGLPGLGNFVGEFLVLLGTYRVSPTLAVLATLGFIVSTIYSLWMIQAVFHGPNKENWKLTDMTPREWTIMASMAAVLIWLGIYPRLFLRTSEAAMRAIADSARIPLAPREVPNDGRSAGVVWNGGRVQTSHGVRGVRIPLAPREVPSDSRASVVPDGEYDESWEEVQHGRR
jgi:NADH-quinone oxidoreductase subunit M